MQTMNFRPIWSRFLATAMLLLLGQATVAAGAEPAGKLNVPPEGFTALFNGKDFTGWRVDPKIKAAWSIEDGALKALDPVDEWIPDLETLGRYRDFVLLVDFRLPSASNSGVYIRGLVPVHVLGGREKIDINPGRMGYPPCPYTQAIAFSNDNGRTFVKYQANPVVPNISGGSDRDPKILWHEPTKKWVMVLYLANGKRFGFFTSDDLKEWKQVSEMGGFHECPELFELPVDGDENNTRWVIFGADAQYFIGSFDGKSFRPDHEKKHRVHHGQYYASQTFNQAPDGRRIQIGWARIAMPGMPFNQTFTVPTRLTLRKTNDGIRMFATPVKEIEQLRKPDPHSVTNTELTAESPAVTFRVLVDRPMYELVGGNGACYKTSARRDMGQPIGKISLTAEGGSLVVESFDVHEMKSIWKE